MSITTSRSASTEPLRSTSKDEGTPVSRRAVLLATIVSPVLAAACSPPDLDGSSTTTTSTTVAGGGGVVTEEMRVQQLMRRAAFGPTPALAAHIASVGAAAWLDEQLTPGSDPTDDDISARFPAVAMTPAELRATYENRRGAIITQLVGARMLRSISTERQLHEVMVGFWTDHFNIDAGIGRIPYLKPAEERDVIRRHALGNFADMLVASASSPAMLVYLDNASSRADGDNIPNENYARELLELHTVGADGGYDEDDVVEVAHVFSGWAVNPRTGDMRFRPEWHDHDPGTEVLGWSAGNETGQALGVSLLHHLARLPATASFLSTKLCRRFIDDEPPPEVVARAAAVYLDNDTAIAPMVREILLSDEFAAASMTKVRRPAELMAAHSRAIDLDLSRVRPDQLVPLATVLRQMGEPLYTWPSPDGPPDTAGPWLNAGTMLQRWNSTASLVAGDLPGASFDLAALRPAPVDDPSELAIELAERLGVGLDEVTQRAAVELLELSDDPVNPSDSEFADLVTLLLVSPSAQRK